jgi:hypothetical protein
MAAAGNTSRYSRIAWAREFGEARSGPRIVPAPRFRRDLDHSVEQGVTLTSLARTNELDGVVGHLGLLGADCWRRGKRRARP